MNAKTKEVGGFATDAINKLFGENNQTSKMVIEDYIIEKFTTNTVVSQLHNLMEHRMDIQMESLK